MLRSIKAGLRTLLRRGDVQRELTDELAHFVEEATTENVRAGMEPSDAARAARAQVGSSASAADLVLSGGWEASVDAFFKDARFGIRAMRRSPGFAVAAMLTIGLGIAASTAMFSVVNAVMLRPLPWPDSGRIALVWTDDVRRGLHREATVYRTITDWQTAGHAFQELAYFSTQRVAPMSNDPGGARGRSRSALVSANLFSVLGVAPARGRTISAADETDRAPVAVISHAFWQRWFAGTPDIIGKSLVVDDASKGGLGTLTVIGVMPPGFYFPDQQTEIWTPATMYWRFGRESTERFPSWARRWTAVGRLAAGASVGDARTDLARIGRQLAAVHVSTVEDFPGFDTTVLPILDTIAGPGVQSALWLLFGAVSMVLLIACVNVANLLLARGAAREQEFAVRRALGAGRSRMVRQLLIESLLLSLAGGVIGTIAAWWGTTVLATAASGFVPRINEIAMDWRVLTFAVVASSLSGIAFGLVPAVRLSNTDANGVLKDGVRSTSGLKLRRGRDVLVMAECALALVLLTGAGLFLRSLNAVQAVSPGFDPSNVLAVRIEFPTEPPPTAEERRQTSEIAPARARARSAAAGQLVDRVRALPGVVSAGITDDLFLAGPGNDSITIPGRSTDEVGSGELNEGSLTTGYFSTLRVPLRRGRLLTNDDVDQKVRALWQPVVTEMPLAEKERRAVAEPVVVTDAFVRRFFPAEDPIGRKFCTDPANKTYWYEIVGIIGDMHRQGLERRPIPEFFGPWLPSSNGRADLLVRASSDPLRLTTSVREEVKRAIPGITVVSVSSVDAQLGGFAALRQLQTWLITIFALVALALAGIGIFGLVNFAVAERRREFGVRIALGASPGEIRTLALRQGMRTPVLGIAIGTAASLVFTRLVSSLLFGVAPADPVTFAAVAIVLGLVAAAACWFASRRVLRIDPVRAVREG